MIKYKKQFIVFFSILILISLFYLILGIPPTIPSNRIKAAIYSKPNFIKQIKLSPFKYIRIKTNLIEDTIMITDNKSITLIANALSKSKKYSSVHPKAVWNCVLGVTNTKGEYKMLIEKTENNEILLDIYSCGEWGLHIGEYRSDELGVVIEKLIK